MTNRFMFRASFLACLLILGAGCFNESSCFTQTVVGPNAASPAGTVSPAQGPCPAVDNITASAKSGSQVAIDSEEELEVTLYAFGAVLQDVCVKSKQIQWSDFHGVCSFSSSQNSANPRFRCASAGSDKTTVTVEGKSATVNIFAK